MVSILHPRLRFASLPAMLGYAAVGAVLAGLYGIAHDQATMRVTLAA